MAVRAALDPHLRRPHRRRREATPLPSQVSWLQGSILTKQLVPRAFPAPCDSSDEALFASATTVTIGDGRTASFWKSNWIGGAPLSASFPGVFQHSRKKNRTVQAALTNDKWIGDLRHGNTGEIAVDFLRLWRQISNSGINLREDVADCIRWTADSSGCYLASSAYRLQLASSTAAWFKRLIWSVWAPGKLKFFFWLLMLNRLWCSDRLQRRGWPNAYFCPLCVRSLETSVHLIWECPFSKIVWATAASWQGCASFAWPASVSSNSLAFSRTAIRNARKEHRPGVRSMILLIAWEIWAERNNCIFRLKMPCSSDVLAAVRRQLEQWRLAGAKALEQPFGNYTVR